MIKIKLIELLNAVESINKIRNCNSSDVNVQFRFKLGILNRDLNNHVLIYNKLMQELVIFYEIEIENTQFLSQDKGNLKIFLEKVHELENIELEINLPKIDFDKSANNISENEILNLIPFLNIRETAI